MIAFRNSGSPKPARGIRAVGFFFASSMTVAMLAGAIVLGHSQAAPARSAGAGQGAAAAPAAPAGAGSAQHGKAVYTRVGCWECHGYDGQGGGGNTGPRIGPNPTPWAAFSYQVRMPRNEMPPYSAKVLADGDLADIYAFLQSVPQPPKVDSLPLLK